MKVVPASATIISATDDAIRHIERCARVCYKSEDKITPDSAEEFVKKILQVKKHESVIEHASVTVHFISDRGVSHELVRHRLCAFSQESTRYCNYSKDKFNNEITVIKPLFWEEGTTQYVEWYTRCLSAEQGYFSLLRQGAAPQQARAILPTCLKTEVMLTTNMREWRHIFKMRCTTAVHPQMREVMIPLLGEFQKRWEVLFSDITPE